MNTRSVDIINAALGRLNAMSEDDVKSRTSQVGIVIPEEPCLSHLLNHFVFDFEGFFSEIINSKKKEWFDISSIKKKHITLEDIMKSHGEVALSILNLLRICKRPRVSSLLST